MPNLERMHWFLRRDCNLERCAYCFSPLPENKVSPERDAQLARVLVENGVREVILGGGEPTLARNLEEVMGILKEGGVYVSLHTNGLLLTDERLERWQGLVDDIALPIDAVDRNTQRQLRGEGFMRVFDNLMDWANKINNKRIKMGWHTVFTAANGSEIPAIYQMINKQPFRYWRIYEYNTDLARKAWLTMEGISDEEKIEGFLKVMALGKLGTLEKGGTDCLLADFLRMEERMVQLGDNRIQFVARKDSRKDPYAFLNNNGQVNFYAWYSGDRRKVLGYISSDGFHGVGEKWRKIREMEEYEEDEWVEAGSDMPFWARLDDGSYWEEEMEAVLPEYVSEVERLANLWQEKNG
jgi:MoaA/NifB/PqqE/SkfB family radical SAM enzyme